MKDQNNEILVSICCITYNQAPYIRQCLDGFIMQKTNFKFEIIVHDDCSTDGTTDIVKEYADKYPDLIVPIFQKVNQYQNGNKRILATFVYPKAIGKYIALCEGDDYWIDPLKLQKQVDFLESHPDYSMCFHNAIEKSGTKERCFSNIKNRDYSGKEILEQFIVATSSVLFINSVIKTDEYKTIISDKKIIVGDLPLWLSCIAMGKCRGFSDTMSVYRRTEMGWTANSKNVERHEQLGDMYFSLNAYFDGQYENILKNKLTQDYLYAIFLSFKLPNNHIRWNLLSRLLKKSTPYIIFINVSKMISTKVWLSLTGKHSWGTS